MKTVISNKGCGRHFYQSADNRVDHFGKPGTTLPGAKLKLDLREISQTLLDGNLPAAGLHKPFRAINGNM